MGQKLTTLAAVGAVQAVANLSNAAVVSAYLTKDVDLSAIANNNAVAANVETVTEKAKIRLSGGDSESAGALRLTVTISIPAPVGSIIDAQTGAINGALVTPFVGKVTTYNGLSTDTVDKVYYSRSR
jgi:oxalate decarboxylase/phosphoglucose isomerase-like protein (cupin superfamily)